MPTLDSEHRELELRIVVLGGASEMLLDALALQEDRLVLGALQGWRPSIRFRAFPVDPWAGDGTAGRELEGFVPYIDALILTDALGEGQHYSSTALEQLRRVLGPGKVGVPTAVFGHGALEQEWATLAGLVPVAAMEPRAENALPLVKSLVGALLRSKMRSVPPPPPR